ncbi:related to TRL1 - tRNA ligase [Ustilago sp. UG-2017a]|nr:related to TRL1 - tRNA ligase [Ustilago sp. UG-2017a]
MSATDPTDTSHIEAEDVATTTSAPEPIKVPNSPTSAFAARSLSDTSPSSSIFTPLHLAELASSTALVSALDNARKAPKPLVRSTGHLVPIPHSPTSQNHHLLSWKVSEFAYRKTTSLDSELPTLARGLFTERLSGPTPSSSEPQHRIVVRGYDKFFNLSELSWVKPESIARYTTPPYLLTFKENGCIIFIAALSPTQLVVTSKHSLGSIEGTEITHAQKGHEWMLKHLSTRGRTEEELASELWKRNETAAFELCDDSFEEHVLAYSEARSGLHLHGLNKNAAKFSTRSMPEVDAFAKQWGFIPTRWIQLGTLGEVDKVTKEIEQTGAWDGEPIEGFVIRTHMPGAEDMERIKEEEGRDKVVRPPYEPGQAWFYKVKFDEPYLMYRDWRELARKMVREKQEWEAKLCTLPSDAIASFSNTTPAEREPEQRKVDLAVEGQNGEAPSKSALKKAKKAKAKLAAKALSSSRAAAQSAGLVPPQPPQPRSKRPETLLFIQWCYDRLYGNPQAGVKAQPGLFAPLAKNKGIIAMRDAFLAYLALHSSFSSSSANPAEGVKEDERPYTQTVLAPIAVPGCGKTILALALGELFGVGMVQSDDFKAKKGFLTAIEKDLRTHAADGKYVLFVDKNNHLLQHRDELIDLCSKLSARNPLAQGSKKKQPAEVGRIRTIALAWDLDSVPLNTLHRLCAERVEKRGDNHQTLVADTEAEGKVRGVKSHEVVLWRFLEALETFGGKERLGEGREGYGDSSFQHVVRLSVHASAEENLGRVIEEVGEVVGWTMPSEGRIQSALKKALEWRVSKKANVDKKKAKEEKKAENDGKVLAPRYFGLAVELDVRSALDSILSGTEDGDSAAEFYKSVKAGGRINLRPHITLVHNSNLCPPDSDTEPNEADRKWQFYTQLLAFNRSRSTDSVFKITLSTLLYETDRLLTWPIDSITPPAEMEDKFWELHEKDWVPHITIATRDHEVRPFEANRVVQQWLENGKRQTHKIRAIKFNDQLTVEARVFGMT